MFVEKFIEKPRHIEVQILGEWGVVCNRRSLIFLVYSSNIWDSLPRGVGIEQKSGGQVTSVLDGSEGI